MRFLLVQMTFPSIISYVVVCTSLVLLVSQAQSVQQTKIEFAYIIEREKSR